MGQSTNAVLAYGYDLGGADHWNLHEADEYGYIDSTRVAWWDDDDNDLTEQAETQLLALIGFRDVWEPGTDFHERKKAAQARLGVHFKAHGYGENPQHLLAAKTITVEWGESKVLDLPALLAEPAEHGWDDKLRAALTALGITPTQEQPGWLLCTYYG